MTPMRLLNTLTRFIGPVRRTPHGGSQEWVASFGGYPLRHVWLSNKMRLASYPRPWIHFVKYCVCFLMTNNNNNILVLNNSPSLPFLILLCGDIHPNPGPVLRFFQWNCHGLTKIKSELLLKVLKDESIDLCLLQETHIDESDPPLDAVFDDYTPFERRRNRMGGGVAVLVSKRLSSYSAGSLLSPSSVDGTTSFEVVSVNVTIDKNSPLHVSSGYFPRGSVSVTDMYKIVPEGTLLSLLGLDANVHHQRFYKKYSTSNNNQDGSSLVQWCDNTGHHIANNPDTATREDFVHQKNESGAPLHKSTSPDVTLFRGINVMNWAIYRSPDLCRLSDHHPLTFQVAVGNDVDATPLVNAAANNSRRPLFSWKKAKWNTFTNLLRKSTNLTARAKAGWTRMSVHQKEQFLADNIRIAQAKAIPRGHHLNKSSANKRFAFMGKALSSKEYREATSNINNLNNVIYNPNSDADTVASAKDQLYKACSTRDRIVREAMTLSYQEKVSKLDGSDSSAWSFIRNAPRKNHANTELKVQTKIVEKRMDACAPPVLPRTKANQLVRMYSGISTRHESSSKPLNRKLLRLKWNSQASAARLKQLGPQRRRPITLTELSAALKSTPTGKAAGEDNLHAESLRRLPRTTLMCICQLLDQTLAKGKIPRRWKEACIIPLLKPGKDASKPESYRPVSLTSVLCKVSERIVANRLEVYLDSVLTDRQSGFRRGRSTADQLAHAFAFIQKARQAGQKNITATLIDFSRAFDKVDHRILLDIMEKLGLPRYLIFWIHDFLRYRRARVMVGKEKSEWKFFSCGVPQGTVLGPLLFLIYINQLAKQLEETGIDFGFFADDLTLFCAHESPTHVENALNHALDVIALWSKHHFMKPAPEKTKYIIFHHSAAPRKSNHVDSAPDLNLMFGGTKLDRVTSATLLGYRFGEDGDGTTHIDYLVGEDRARLSQLASVAGTSWGPPAQTLRTFYTGYCLGKLNYGVEAWMHLTSRKQQDRLEIQHRQAARIITGCVQATRISSLLNEADLAPLEDIALIRSFKYMEQCKRLTGLRHSNAEAIFDSQHPATLLSQEIERKSKPPDWTQPATPAAANAQMPNSPTDDEGTNNVAPPPPTTRPRGRPGKNAMQQAQQQQQSSATVIQPPSAAAPRDPHLVPAFSRPYSFDTVTRRVKIHSSVIPNLPSNATPDMKQHATQMTIDQRFPTTTFRTWTDGSSHIAHHRSGGAAYIEQVTDETDKLTGRRGYKPVAQLMVPAGTLSCSMTSESFALRAAAKRMIGIVKQFNSNYDAQLKKFKMEYRSRIRQLQKEHAVSPLRKLLRRLLYSSKYSTTPVRKKADSIATQICHDPRAIAWREHFGFPADASKIDCNNISNVPARLFDDQVVLSFMKTKWCNDVKNDHFPRIARRRRPTVVFLSDSQSLLRSLQKGPLLNRTDPVLYDIWLHLQQLSKHARVSLQHVRSHCGIEGNEIVDKLADEASKLPQTGVPNQLRDIVAAAKQQLRVKRASQIACERVSSHRFLVLGHERRQKLSKTQMLPRRIERQLAQLRTGKHPLVGTFHRAIFPMEHPSCRWCESAIHDQQKTQIQLAAAAAEAHQRRVNDEIGDPYLNRTKGFTDPHYCPDCYKQNPNNPQQGVFQTKRNLHRHMTSKNACPLKKSRTEEQVEKLCGIVKNGRDYYRLRDATEQQLAAKKSQKDGRLERNGRVIQTTKQRSSSSSSSSSSDSSVSSHEDEDDRNLWRLYDGKNCLKNNNNNLDNNSNENNVQQQQQNEQNHNSLLPDNNSHNNDNTSVNNNNNTQNNSNNTNSTSSSSSLRNNNNNNNRINSNNDEKDEELNQCKVFICGSCNKSYKSKKPYEKHMLICESGSRSNSTTNNNNNSKTTNNGNMNNNNNSSQAENGSSANFSSSSSSTANESSNNNNSADEFVTELVKHVILECPRLQQLRTICGINASRKKELWYSAEVVEFLDLALVMIGKEPLLKWDDEINKKAALAGIIQAGKESRKADTLDLELTNTKATSTLAEFRNAQFSNQNNTSNRENRANECAHQRFDTSKIGSDNTAPLKSSSYKGLVVADVQAIIPMEEKEQRMMFRIRDRCTEASDLGTLEKDCYS